MKRSLPSLLRLTPRRALLIGCSAAVALSAIPAAAQFFPFGGPRFERPMPPPPPPGWPFSPFEDRRPRQQERAVDYSRAPAPKKSETQPQRSVVVLGDSMADWLAYGLEDAFSETPEIGVVRRIKTVSGLIQYERKGKPADWVEAAKDLLPKEKPDAVVVMLGLNDRRDIEEPAPEKKADAAEAGKKPGDKSAAKPGEAKQSETKPGQDKPAQDKSTQDKPQQERAAADDEDDADSIVAPEPRGSAAGKGGIHEFRSERWVELYRRKITDMIAVAKASGAPVIWVGLPAVRGQRATSDASFLGSLFREEASKAGITYVDVWDGFVDEAGRFLTMGADFEGQSRRLRTADGVYFTKAGARKLAHYAEREIRRVLASRSAPVAIPSDPGTPDPVAKPGAPAPRPLAGPIVPLAAPTVGTDQLLGGAGTVPAKIDTLAARILVKGEAMIPPAGRADDYAWPRRQFGSSGAGGEEPVPPIAAEDPKPVAVAPPPGETATRRASSSGEAGSRGAGPPPPAARSQAAPQDAGLRPPGAIGAGPMGQPARTAGRPMPSGSPFGLLDRLFGR